MLGTFNGGQLLYFLTLYLPQPEICTPSDVAYFNRIKGTVAKLVHQETHLELLSQLLYTLSVSEKSTSENLFTNYQRFLCKLFY